MKQQSMLLLVMVGMSIGVMATPDCSGVTDPCSSCFPYQVEWPSNLSRDITPSGIDVTIYAIEQDTVSVADMEDGPCSSSQLSQACELWSSAQVNVSGLSVQSEGPNGESPLYGCGDYQVYAVTSELCAGEDNTGSDCYCCVQAYNN